MAYAIATTQLLIKIIHIFFQKCRARYKIIVENVYYCVKSKEALTSERRPPIQLSLLRTEYKVGNFKKPRMINKNERSCFCKLGFTRRSANVPSQVNANVSK